MEFALFQMIKLTVLTAMAVALQQLFRHVGKPLVSELFEARPTVGRGLVALSDIGFYCLYAAYIVFNLQVNDDGAGLSADEIQSGVHSVGWFFLTIGFLHCCNLAFLALVGHSVAKRARREAAWQAWTAPTQAVAPGPGGSGTPQSSY